MNYNLFKSERERKWDIFLNFDYAQRIASGQVDQMEDFFKMEFTEEDVAVCKQIFRTNEQIGMNTRVPLTSKHGDFFNVYSWCARYCLLPMEGSYKRFLLQRGIKEDIELRLLFEKVWLVIDLMYGWGKK